jgi:hypothetical protein
VRGTQPRARDLFCARALTRRCQARRDPTLRGLPVGVIQYNPVRRVRRRRLACGSGAGTRFSAVFFRTLTHALACAV